TLISALIKKPPFLNLNSPLLFPTPLSPSPTSLSLSLSFPTAPSSPICRRQTVAKPTAPSPQPDLSALSLSLRFSLPKLPVNLLKLALKVNSFSGSFDGLTQIEVIELSENSFTCTLQSWFVLLPALQQVDLANNDLTRVDIAKPTSGISDLVAVDLGFNKIEGNLTVNFADYPLLSSLSMRYNGLRGTIPLEYSEKKSLISSLSLSTIFLAGIRPDFRKSPPPTSISLNSISIYGLSSQNKFLWLELENPN
ncbi:hypothetical protein CFOL_v3_29806, partial [Cephalotus follicularis]